MISRKLSKSRTHKKIKIQKGGAVEYNFLLNDKWVDAKPYQQDAMNILVREIASNQDKKNIPYTYNKDGFKFSLRFLYHVDTNNEYIFEMTRENGTVVCN